MKNIVLFFLFISCSTFCQSGKVISITDGDTIIILDSLLAKHKVRVADIDCPEKGQPFGTKAKQFTSNEIYGKHVSIIPKDPSNPTDKYGRILGYVKYNSKDLSEELLKQGLAWHYKYYSKDKHLSLLESEAKKIKIGLWSDPHPINPYQWRKRIKE